MARGGGPLESLAGAPVLVFCRHAHSATVGRQRRVQHHPAAGLASGRAARDVPSTTNWLHLAKSEPTNRITGSSCLCCSAGFASHKPLNTPLWCYAPRRTASEIRKKHNHKTFFEGGYFERRSANKAQKTGLPQRVQRGVCREGLRTFSGSTVKHFFALFMLPGPIMRSAGAVLDLW